MTDPLELPVLVAKEVAHAGRALVDRTRSQLELAQRLAGALPCLGRRSDPAEEADDAPLAGATLTVVPPVPDDGTDDVESPTEPSPIDAPAATQLAIPDYDSLAASQVVPRLASLTSAELDDVGAYERAHRARQTILNRVRQLQSPAGA